MDDLDKVARELLAQANERLGLKSASCRIRDGDMDAHEREFCNAIHSALLTSPPGYALVPAVPTDAMLSAGFPRNEVIDDCFDRRGAWADMLAAAPEMKS